jgi:hypothetical protein
MAQIVLKAPDDLLLLVRSRIDAHNAALAAERSRVRAEEEARAAAKVKAEQEEAEREMARKVEADSKLCAQEEAEHKHSLPPDIPCPTVTTLPHECVIQYDEPAIWRNAKQSVVVMLDGLTISELQEVANFIGRKAWRRAA